LWRTWKILVRPVDPSSIGVTNRAHQELLDEVVNLLSMGDASEGSVLSADEHAGVEHDRRRQEASLTLCQIERHEDLSALGCRRVRP